MMMRNWVMIWRAVKKWRVMIGWSAKKWRVITLEKSNVKEVGVGQSLKKRYDVRRSKVEEWRRSLTCYMMWASRRSARRKYMSRIVRLYFLGVAELKQCGVKCVASLCHSMMKVGIFAFEWGVDDKNGIKGSLTDCNFGSIHADPKILLKRNKFFLFSTDVIKHFKECIFRGWSYFVIISF